MTAVPLLREYVLYRLYNSLGELLYIGRTQDVTTRFRRHARRQHWWREVDQSTFESFATLEELIVAEQLVIQAEGPKYNIAHNGVVRARRRVRPTRRLIPQITACDLTDVDAVAVRARELHLASRESDQRASFHRARRDRLVKELRAENPQRWTYPALAAAVKCSPELVAAIVKGRVRTKEKSHDGDTAGH